MNFTHNPFDFMAAMPGIGPAREKQEEWNKLYILWQDYQAKSQAYNAALAQVNMQALHKFGTGQPPQSFKDMQNQWTNAAEDVYAAFAIGPEHAELYSAMVNASLAWQKQFAKVMNDIAAQAGLPTRAEIDGLHDEIRRLKKELAAFKKTKAKKKK